MKAKPKKCRNPECKKEFFPFKSTEKFCSPFCYNEIDGPKLREKRARMLREEPFHAPKIAKRTKTKKIDAEYASARAKLVKHQFENTGGNFCMRCGYAYNLQTHHIIYQSEAKHHPELNNLRNLTILCGIREPGITPCHTYYHEKKDRREHLINERNLVELFGAEILNKK